MLARKLIALLIGTCVALLTTCANDSSRRAAEPPAPAQLKRFGAPLRATSPSSASHAEGQVPAGQAPSAVRCAHVWDEATFEEVKVLPHVTHVRLATRALSLLSKKEGPQLTALRELREHLDSLLKVREADIDSESGWSVELEAVRARVQALTTSDAACVAFEPSGLASQFSERVTAELEDNWLLQRGANHWQPTPSAREAARVLDAFFSLQLLARPVVPRCELPVGLDFTWNAPAIDAVALMLEAGKPGRLRVLRDAAARVGSEPAHIVTRALPGGVCEQLTLLSCSELQAAREPVATTTGTGISVLRARAVSLKQAAPALLRLRQASHAWGCSEGAFGLDAAQRYAESLLTGATQHLEERTRALTLSELDKRLASVPLTGANKSAVQELERNVQVELFAFRLEVSALAFVVAEPGLDFLSRLSLESSSGVPSWRTVVEDLRGRDLGKPFGASGLFAFEQVYGLLLANPKVRCPKQSAPWAQQVFSMGEGLFQVLGRSLLAGLQQYCVGATAG